MPYRISWPDNTFLVTFSGDVTARDIEAVNYAFSGDARMETVRYSVWDFLHAETLGIPEEALEEAAAFDKGVTYVRPNLKGAIIVDDHGVRAVIEKYMEAAEELDVSWDTRLFDSMEAARHWLEPGAGRA